MKTMQIEGMSCEHCVAAVTKALEGLPGVENVRVSLLEKQAAFDLSDSSVTDELLKGAIEDIGFDVVGMSGAS